MSETPEPDPTSNDTDTGSDLPTLPPMVGDGISRPVTRLDTLHGETDALPEIEHDTYKPSGEISLDEVINGDAAARAHLDPHIITVRDWAQDRLATAGRADDIAAARHDPTIRQRMVNLIDQLALQYMNKENIVGGEDRKYVIAAVVNEVIGLGPIEPLMSEPTVTEIMVNSPTDIRIERQGKLTKATGVRFRDTEHLLDVCGQILQPLNRRVDPRNPMEDGRLPDGSRVNVVHNVVAAEGPTLTIRRFPSAVWTLRSLAENGSLTEDMACTLAWLIYHKCSVIVAGGTGAGKTSLLNALSSCIPRDERVVTVEDSLELQFHPNAHVVPLEARPASASGEGQVTVRQLVRNALRMRPDRIVVGEVRDATALDMLQACNTGHEGSMTTVHANGPDEAVSRLEVLVAQGGEIPDDKVGWLIGDALDLIVYQRRFEDGSRRVQSIAEVPTMRSSAQGDKLRPTILWQWKQTGTDPLTGRFTGEYQKVNDLSDDLKKRRRLDQFRLFTMADVNKLSVVEG